MIDQRTDEWKEQRRGKFTASEIHKLMGARGLNKTGETYIMEKVAESLGAVPPDIETAAMRYGTEMEPVAKRFYSTAFNCSISEQGFITAEWNHEAGCSPDGLVVEFNEQNEPKPIFKGIEIKCPFTGKSHVEHLLIKSQDDLKKVAPEYYWQIQMSMAVTGLKAWDFVSFHPEFTGNLKMVAIEIQADEQDIILLKERIFEAVATKRKLIELIQL